MQAWEASIDRQLAVRLARTGERPGVIRMALVRRILAGIAAMTERLPLLARFGRRRALAATIPIVHARWMPPGPVETTTVRPAATPIVHATSSRVVDRSSAPATTRELPPPASQVAPHHASERAVERGSTSTAALEPPATVTPEHASGSGARPPATPVVPPHTIEGALEHASASTLVVEPPAVAARPHASAAGTSRSPAIAPAHIDDVAAAMSEAQPEASHASSRVLARSADPVVRRSRVGAPLPARPPIARPIEGHVPKPARPLIAPSSPAATTSPGGESGRSIVQPVGKASARVATTSSIVHVRPRATVAGLPAMISGTAVPASTPVVATTTARKAPLLVSAIPPVVVSVTRSEHPLVERRPVSVVRPGRTGEGERAHAAELPLAQPTPAAVPAAVTARPIDPAPIVSATPRSVAETAAPPPPAPPKIDLHRLAEQVQRILVRQAEHARARQGLPR